MRPLDYIATYEERIKNNIAEILGTNEYEIEIEEIDVLDKTMSINIDDVELRLFYEEGDIVIFEESLSIDLNDLIERQFDKFGYGVSYFE